MTRVKVVLRRAWYAVAALPVALAAGVFWLIGRREAAQRLDAGLLERAFGPGPHRRPVARGVVAAPVYAVAMYLLLVLILNLAYPLRSGVGDGPIDAWGGPTLAGAWAVHAVGGTAFVLLIGIPVLAVLGTTLAGLAGRTAGADPEAT